LPNEVIIKKITQLSVDTKLFTLAFKDKIYQGNFSFLNGQFAMVGIPGAGEAAYNICSDPSASKKFWEIAVRKVGRLTSIMHQLKVGDSLWVRAPFGQGWPKLKNLQTANLLLVGGGCGFVPFRSVALEILNDKKLLKNFQVKIFYGCSGFDYLIFKDEFVNWQKFFDVKLIFDKEKKLPKANKLFGVKCDLGLITKLFDLYPITSDATAFLCGPAIMYKFVLEKLKQAGVPDQNIYLSLERRMDCGFGICQHCACGDKYVCTDGPIFRYDKIKETELI